MQNTILPLLPRLRTVSSARSNSQLSRSRFEFQMYHSLRFRTHSFRYNSIARSKRVLHMSSLFPFETPNSSMSIRRANPFIPNCDIHCVPTNTLTLSYFELHDFTSTRRHQNLQLTDTRVVPKTVWVVNRSY